MTPEPITFRAESPRKKWLFVGIILIKMLVLAGALGWWGHGKFEAARERMESLEARLAVLEHQAAAPDQADSSELQQNIQRLEERLDLVISENASNVSKEEDAEGVRLLLAYERLLEAVASGKPYAQELQALQELAAEAPPLSEAAHMLDANANPGIRRMEDLIREFQSLVPQALSSAKPERTGWLAKLSGWLSEIVTIRRVTAAPGDMSTAGILSQVEAALQAGALKEAIELLDKLEEQPRSIYADWNQQASARLETLESLQQLKRAILAYIASAAG